MNGHLPLPTLLSHALVAFTIEFDNESERQITHWTTRHGSKSGRRQGVWLVSLAMWANCMQFLDDEGITVRELERRARTKTNLNGMQRWGNIMVAPDPADPRPKPPRSAWLVRVTPAGRQAQDVWRPLFGVIENRWRERFGEPEIDALRESLWAVASQFDVELPDCLPILGYGLFSRGPEHEQPAEHRRKSGAGSDLPLSALLSRVLLAFAIEFERESGLSFAISANILRVLDENGVRVRDLPLLSGVSKEAISMAIGFLRKKRLVEVAAENPASRFKAVRLTARGCEAKVRYLETLAAIEKRWSTRFGKDAISALRAALEPLVGEPTAEKSPLFRGLEPYPDGWRAAVPRLNTLPHYPMVLHRGGYPDGS